MTVNVPAQATRAEARDIETLRKRYEDRGFAFVVHPPQDAVPSFLRPFEPDAIARKPGEGIIVEVKTQQGPFDNRSVVELRRRIAGQPDWTLDVAYVSSFDANSISIPSAKLSRVRELAVEATDLRARGHSRAAFLLAWSLLEASRNAASGKASSYPRSPGQVVEWLGMNGNLDLDKEPRLRELADLRNRLAHGDLSVDASGDDVDLVLSAIEDSLVDLAA